MSITTFFPIDYNSKSLKVKTFIKYVNTYKQIAIMSKKKLLKITKKDIKILFTNTNANKYPLDYLILFIKGRFNKVELSKFLKKYPEVLEFFI
jgi:hypothetical protein